MKKILNKSELIDRLETGIARLIDAVEKLTFSDATPADILIDIHTAHAATSDAYSICNSQKYKHNNEQNHRYLYGAIAESQDALTRALFYAQHEKSNRAGIWRYLHKARFYMDRIIDMPGAYDE